MIELIKGDCLIEMNKISDKTIDLILCDLPYGVLNKSNSNAKWDCQIPLTELWQHYERIIKDNGAIILFGSGMFTAQLMMSNSKLWRYNLIWDKMTTTGFLNANRMPLRQHEDIVVFYKKLPIYNPQMKQCSPDKKNHSKGNINNFTQKQNNCYGDYAQIPRPIIDKKYPTSIISIPKEHCNGQFLHPTQKPVALLEWLINTYTNEGELVLDNCAGSMSTAIACINTNRKYIMIEKDEKYFNIGSQRIKNYLENLNK